MANLRQCFMSEDEEPSEKDRRESHYITLLDRSQTAARSVSWGQGSAGSRTLFATSLQMVLKGVIEHILRSSKYEPLYCTFIVSKKFRSLKRRGLSSYLNR